MTTKEKELLLLDLCGRLPYGVKYQDRIEGGIHVLSLGTIHHYERFISYLRPMSSMTEDERNEYRKLGGVMSYNSEHNTWAMCAFTPEAYDWLNKKMFDYRGLIPMGLALEATKDMYV